MMKLEVDVVNDIWSTQSPDDQSNIVSNKISIKLIKLLIWQLITLLFSSHAVHTFHHFKSLLSQNDKLQFVFWNDECELGSVTSQEFYMLCCINFPDFPVSLAITSWPVFLPVLQEKPVCLTSALPVTTTHHWLPHLHCTFPSCFYNKRFSLQLVFAHESTTILWYASLLVHDVDVLPAQKELWWGLHSSSRERPPKCWTVCCSSESDGATDRQRDNRTQPVFERPLL